MRSVHVVRIRVQSLIPQDCEWVSKDPYVHAPLQINPQKIAYGIVAKGSPYLILKHSKCLRNTAHKFSIAELNPGGAGRPDMNITIPSTTLNVV